MGRKRIEENEEYKILRDAWSKFRQDEVKFEERMALERSIQDEAMRMRRSKAVVDAVNNGLSVNGVGRAVGHTAHIQREKLVNWAFDYNGIKRPDAKEEW